MNLINRNSVWFALACALLALTVGIVLFATFLRRKNKGRFSGFSGRIYDFFQFNWLVGKPLLSFLYLISALFLTLYSFEPLLRLGNGQVGSILVTVGVRLVPGNLILRLAYELLTAIFLLCRNISEINRKLGGKALSDAGGAEQSAHPAPPPANGIVFCRQCGNRFGAADTMCPHCGTTRMQ